MVTVGSREQAAKLVKGPPPVYPALAKSARIQGVVRFNAIIDKAGKVQDVKVISGHPLLVKAAQDAVRHWEYRPTLSNGKPVTVTTTIDVEFKP